ncbi:MULTISPECIES: hypothetical protein [unclassified Duganella]|jgi:hypothetical protein|uniref:hypothetical protein n=1 Tax=unclassified Duganella TaxID=2636909 RepID=UPI0008857415|nr:MULTISPECIES: hypothetical protein [unclassified Duganella]SDG41212.1 hypothetical protein SAMN05216320_104240 [Duganella sp. OV458]SDJ62791.1 hypothetical protein SAMN05428973_105164 [Duganella sp. OV510]
MARNPVHPVAAIDAVQTARVGGRGAAYFFQLEQWMMYSQMYAVERLKKEQAATAPPFQLPQAESGSR